jgi:hypothetical protein
LSPKQINKAAGALSAAALITWQKNQDLECFGYVSGADAAGADLDAPDGTVSHGLDLLQIRAPNLAGSVVGVADVIPEARAFTAYLAYSGHFFVPSGVY